MTENNLKSRDRIAEEKRQWVRITRICNNKCLFCLDRDSQNGEYIPLSEVRKKLKDGRNNGATRVIISGGEPSIHPKIFEIIKDAKRIGYDHVQMISNGRMFAYDEFSRKAKEAGLDEITLSLHSHLKEPFEEMTGIRGSYGQAMKGLINARKRDFIVSVDIVINKINVKSLRDTLAFFIRLGVSEFDLLYLIPFGSAWENRKKLFFDPRKYKKYIDQALDLSSNKDLFIWTNRMPAAYLEGHEELIQNPLKIKDEVRGMEYSLKNFMETGKPMPCAGERCEFCFLRGFCEDITALRKEKKLGSQPSPVCIKKEKKKLKAFVMSGRFNLDKFTDFYIRHRYHVKSLRCLHCSRHKECPGEHINEIRRHGFKILDHEKCAIKKQAVERPSSKSS